MALIFETIDLRKRFHVGDTEIEVLKGLNLKIEKGEFVIIFGPSGCGKSTLLHCLLGLEEPTSGKILVEGKDYYEGDEDSRALYRRHKVGTIYQQSLWINACTVLENVAFPLHLLDMSAEEIEKKAMDKLALVGMDKWATYTPTELSSGQQQKINLARALTIDPIMIIADEPTGNLDTMSGQELIDTFLKLGEDEKTIIMVTHDLEYLKYATHVFHMIDGEVVEEIKRDNSGVSKQVISGKKEIGGSGLGSNVRDKDFLKKLNF
ncbi:ABC transporter ATP-binding protein [Candidatus Microgenomates bacterium]|nr:ABC transporter ATP-binding protein [Candidatus Microgenomates bacterium]